MDLKDQKAATLKKGRGHQHKKAPRHCAVSKNSYLCLAILLLH